MYPRTGTAPAVPPWLAQTCAPSQHKQTCCSPPVFPAVRYRWTPASLLRRWPVQVAAGGVNRPLRFPGLFQSTEPLPWRETLMRTHLRHRAYVMQFSASIAHHLSAPTSAATAFPLGMTTVATPRMRRCGTASLSSTGLASPRVFTLPSGRTSTTRWTTPLGHSG